MSKENDKRKVRFGDLVFDDPLSLYRIMHLIKDYGADAPGEFWSEREGDWRTMVGVLNDFRPYPDERLASMIEAGIQWVKVLDSGHSDDCPACKKLAGQRYRISSPPRLPPNGCSCRPWCRCCMISVE